MNERDLESISRFVSQQGAVDLFAYFELDRDAAGPSVEAAIRRRRSWAQGQQANPKYRQTALWLIKNVALCKRALSTERTAYLAYLNATAQAGALEILGNVMDGAVFNRTLSSEREEAVLDRGVQLGLTDSVVEQFIETYLDIHEAFREEPEAAVDIYELLSVSESPTPEAVEDAVRRALAKSGGAGPAATQRRREVRRAARILRSPDRHKEYQRERAQYSAGVPGLAAPNEREAQLDPTVSQLAFRDADTSSTDPPTDGAFMLRGDAPPAPPSLGGRTLPMGTKTGSVRRPSAPQFEIEGDLQRHVRVGRSPVELTFTVRSASENRLHGKIICDRGWLSVTPDRLDPDRKEQVITVTIDPALLTRNRAVALCTVTADRGSRKSVTITAERARIKPGWFVMGALSLVAASGFLLWPQISAKLFPPPPPPPPSATLHVEVNPKAGEVYIDNRIIAAGGRARDIQNLSVKRPVLVRVLLDGFQLWEQEFDLKDGEEKTITPTLILTDPMDYVPEEEAIQGRMDQEAVSRAIRGRSTEFQSCITEHEPGEDRVERTIEMVSHVLSAGHIGSVSFNGPQVPSKGSIHCIKRELRSLHVPIFEGDYDVSHEAFIVSYPNPTPGSQ